MKLSNDFLLRTLLGENILVYTGSDSQKATKLFKLNETGMFIVSNMEKCGSVSELVRCLTDEYEIDEDTALSDVTDYVEELRNAGAIID